MTITATGTEMLSKPLSFGTLKNGQTTISNGSTVILGVGDTTTLSVTGAESVIYSSSDNSKVTVNASTGEVEAIGVGSAVITVTGVDSSETMTVNVEVTKKLTIGDTVNYSTSLSGVTLDNWKVFYVDGDYTYIILSDCLPNAAVSNAIKTTYSIELFGTYGIYANNSRADLINAMETKSNWDSLLTGTINGIGVSETRTANVWAMGAPDVDLWGRSWNTTHPDDILYTRYINSEDIDHSNGCHAEGYSISDTTPVTGASVALALDTLYCLRGSATDSGCFGYWLASPSTADTSMVLNANAGSCITPRPYNYNETRGHLGFRPIICLPSSVVNQ